MLLSWFVGAQALVATLNVDDVVQQVERTYDKYKFTVFFSPSHSTKGNSTVAFAHGFGLTAEKYAWLAQSLALAGHIVVLPHSSGAPDSKLLALAAAAGAAGVLNESNIDSSSPFFGLAGTRWASCGHSLGGGTSFLSADPSILSGQYPAPTSILTLSAGVYTIPKALDSAPRVSNSTPTLMLTATQDCIDPPQKNSLPLFNDIGTNCKGVVSLIGGSHCQYAAESLDCEATEHLCGAHPNITREQQQTEAATLAVAWLQFVDSQVSIESFLKVINASVTSRRAEVMASEWQGCNSRRHWSKLCGLSCAILIMPIYISLTILSLSHTIRHWFKSNIRIPPIFLFEISSNSPFKTGRRISVAWRTFQSPESKTCSSQTINIRIQHIFECMKALEWIQTYLYHGNVLCNCNWNWTVEHM